MSTYATVYAVKQTPQWSQFQNNWRTIKHQWQLQKNLNTQRTGIHPIKGHSAYTYVNRKIIHTLLLHPFIKKDIYTIYLLFVSPDVIVFVQMEISHPLKLGLHEEDAHFVTLLLIGGNRI